VGVLVIGDGLGNQSLKLVEVHELLLGLHLGQAHEVGVGEEALDQAVDELLDLCPGERLGAERATRYISVAAAEQSRSRNG
jgi:hypothetical protein